MKRTPVYLITAIALVLSVGLYSCSEQENAPVATTSGDISALYRKPVKPVVTVVLASTAADTSVAVECSVWVSPSAAVLGQGHLVLEKKLGYLGGDTSCAGPFEVVLDSFLVVNPADTCHVFTITTPNVDGTYGYEGSFAPNRKDKINGNKNHVSGDGECVEIVVTGGGP